MVHRHQVFAWQNGKRGAPHTWRQEKEIVEVNRSRAIVFPSGYCSPERAEAQRTLRPTITPRCWMPIPRQLFDARSSRRAEIYLFRQRNDAKDLDGAWFAW